MGRKNITFRCLGLHRDENVLENVEAIRSVKRSLPVACFDEVGFRRPESRLDNGHGLSL